MSTRASTPAEGPAREATWLVVAFGLGLLAARLLAAGYGMFIENDETSLAAGIAALLRDSPGPVYRYGPQAGYYQLVVILTRLLGGDVLTIPLIQVTLSVLAGTLLPLLGLLAFRADLSRLERWLVAGTLAASPIIWMTSRYGGSALLSTALAVAGFVLLSNRPGRAGELGALALVAGAIFIRADAVLATPGIAVLLWRNHGSLRTAALRFAGLGTGVAAGYAGLLLVDPRMRAIGTEVAKHMSSGFGTMFWEYLLWAVSPFPLIFAVLGLPTLASERRWLLAALAAWTLPVLAFYFPATTQPRYFLLPAFALAIATAVGITSIARAAGRWRPHMLAAGVALCGVHLLVGLGHFGAGQRRSFLTEASIETQVGPMWTGALLYKSFWAPGLTRAPIWHPRFGTANLSERSLTVALGQLKAGASGSRHVVLVFAPRYGNLLHFYAQAAGVEGLEKGPGTLFLAEYAMRLGDARLTLHGLRALAADTTEILPVAGGDEVWLYSPDDSAAESVLGRLPAGLAASPDSQWTAAPRIWRFRVAGGP